jgi:hypothetical protein
LARTFAVDVLECPTCQGRMKLLALVKDPKSITGYLATVGEETEVPRRSPGRGPPFWKSRVLRRHVLGEEDGFGQNILGDADNEPSIAVSPTNPLNMVIGWRQFDNVTSNFRTAAS